MQVTQPVRVRHTYTQTIIAPPEKVFPLLCPVREIEWANGWNPRQVITASGVIEPDCTFVVPGEPQDSIWVVTRWDPEEFRVEFVKVSPGFTVGKIEIQLREADGNRTFADIAYAYTALSPEGERFVEQFTSEQYQAFMEQWESELNHFIRTTRMKAT